MKTNKDTDNGSGSNHMSEELHRLFLDELADIMNAEEQLTKALPKLAEAADSEELADAFRSHLEETKGHVERTKQIFESLSAKVKSKTCKAMKGLVEEGSEIMDDLEGSTAIDAGLIAAAQKVEHYEIASYGSLRAWAEQMGHSDAVRLIDQTLEEEKAADEKLTEIAENIANRKAA